MSEVRAPKDGHETTTRDWLDTKVFLIVLILLLVIIIVLVAVMFCWKCWRHRLLTNQNLPRSQPRFGPMCMCVRNEHFRNHARRMRSDGLNGCSVEMICEPNECFVPWSPYGFRHHHHLVSNYPNGAGNVPRSYPMEADQATERDGLNGEIAPRTTGQSCDGGLNTEDRSGRAAMLAVRSPVHDDVRRESDDREQTMPMTSLGSILAPIHSHTAVMYRPDNESIVLGSSQTSSNLQETSQRLPMNIECPGLFDTFPPAMRDLFVPALRSEMRTVVGKLVVSLARLVDTKGDFLVLDNMGISLQIPPGAIREGQKQLVSLVLNWDLSDNPDMDNTQALVSPVVYCGPHGVKFDKPCLLSFKHCAFDPRMVQVMSSQTDLAETKDWQVMCSAEEDTGLVSMTTDECQVRLQHFSLFTGVQTPPANVCGKKWLTIAAFCAPLQKQVHHYQVRVYFLNKTPCALQWAIQNEAKFGFRLACPERTFLFQGSGEDLHLVVDYVSRGWVAVRENHVTPQHENEGSSVSYHTIWHGKCPHLSFCFKRTCLLPDPPPQPAPAPSGVTTNTSFPVRMQPHVSEINLNLRMFQESSANSPDMMNILLTESPSRLHHHQPTSSSPSPSPVNDSAPGCYPTHLLPTCDKHPISISMPSVPVSHGRIRGKVRIDTQSSQPSVMVDFDQDQDCLSSWPFGVIGQDLNEAGEEVYPQDLKLQLKLKLDVHSLFGHDWKLLASKVKLDKYIPWLMSQESPTIHVLQFMETQRMDLHYLRDMLKSINRSDAAQIVQDVIDKRHGMMTSNRGEAQEHSFCADIDAHNDFHESFLKEFAHGGIDRPESPTAMSDEPHEHCDKTVE